MTYIDQWHALSSRIRGLMQAGQLNARYLIVRSTDPYGRGNRLLKQSGRIFSALEAFFQTFGSSLPGAARSALEEFLANNRGLLTREAAGTADELQERAWAALVLLAVFETEMSFVLADVQESIRARCERALLHLQRCLVVDETFQGKWRTAFDADEVECERHGAVHLLLHGIWAFKVNAAGERTDLVFQDSGNSLSRAHEYADGLVLTEWKKATSKDEAERRFGEARAQAERYAQGALAGVELTSVRYLIVVSREQVTTPDDFIDGGIIYRHINIAVEPRVPSRTRVE